MKKIHLHVDGINLKTIKIGLIRGGAVALAMGLQIWLVEKFGASSYGEYVQLITLCSLVVIVAKGGLDTLILKESAVVNELKTKCHPENILFGYLKKGSLLTIFVCLGLWAANTMASISRGITEFNWLIVFGVSLGLTLFQIIIAYTRGVNKIIIADGFESIFRQVFMVMIALIMLALNYKGSMVIILSYGSSFYIATAMLYRLNMKGEGYFPSNKEEMPIRYDARAHSSFMLLGLLGFTFFQFDTLFLGEYIDSAELGAYNMACNFVRLIIFVPLILCTVIQPKIAVAYSLSNYELIYTIVARTIFKGLAASVVAFIFLALVGEKILFWINPSFINVTSAMMILAGAHILNSVIIIVSGVAYMTSRYREILSGQIIGAVVTIFCYLLLIPDYKQVGAAISVFLGLFAALGIYCISFQKHLMTLHALLLRKTK